MAIRSPAAAQSKEQRLRRIRESAYGFARSSANLPSFSAGMRIAAPVCALVRNDMQKEGRVRGCKDVARKVRGNMPGVSGCKDVARNDTSPLSLRGAKRRGNPFSCGSAKRKAILWANTEKLRICPKYYWLARYCCGDADCRTSVRTGSQ